MQTKGVATLELTPLGLPLPPKPLTVWSDYCRIDESKEKESSNHSCYAVRTGFWIFFPVLRLEKKQVLILLSNFVLRAFRDVLFRCLIIRTMYYHNYYVN